MKPFREIDRRESRICLFVSFPAWPWSKKWTLYKWFFLTQAWSMLSAPEVRWFLLWSDRSYHFGSWIKWQAPARSRTVGCDLMVMGRVVCCTHVFLWMDDGSSNHLEAENHWEGGKVLGWKMRSKGACRNWTKVFSSSSPRKWWGTGAPCHPRHLISPHVVAPKQIPCSLTSEDEVLKSFSRISWQAEIYKLYPYQKGSKALLDREQSECWF